MSEKRMLRRARGGFTLVELMIVVIILSILAAIIVPQFVSSTDDAKDSALESSLSNVRAAIDLYYQQHGEFPGRYSYMTAMADGFTNDDFLKQLSLYTDGDGVTMGVKDDMTYKYGPYFRKDTLPEDPIHDTSALVIEPDTSDGDLEVNRSGVTTGGWYYDATTGKFLVNHEDYDHL